MPMDRFLVGSQEVLLLWLYEFWGTGVKDLALPKRTRSFDKGGD